MEPEVIISPGKKGKIIHMRISSEIIYLFPSLLVETFGSWGPTTLKFISEIGRNIKEKRDNNKTM